MSNFIQNRKKIVPMEYPMHEIEPMMTGPEVIVYGGKKIPPETHSIVT